MPTIDRILLVGHTHHDVGYTNSPRIIDPQHARIVSEVLDLADRHASTGPDDFRWTFEVSRPVLAFLEHASPRDRERLRSANASGRISVTGGPLNLTQLPSAFEVDTAYDAVATLRDAGLTVRTVQHGDVNGIAWGNIDAMARAGLDRLVMALNPDHGRPPFEQPSAFAWESPSRRRAFVWLSTHYGFGEEWGIVDGDVELAERRIAEFVSRLGSRDDYPFDTAVVHAANDNRWPTADFLDVVRYWNHRHPEVPMRTATMDDALDRLMEQVTAPAVDGASSPGDLPVYRGEWSDWWAHGHGSTAREVAAYREARTFARAGENLLSLALLAGDPTPRPATVLGYRRGPAFLRSDQDVVDTIREVDEQSLLFAEHTWGSWESYSKPHSMLSHSHWNAKAGFAYAAYDHARDLAVEAFHRRAAVEADTGVPVAVTAGSGSDSADEVLLLNPTPRERTESVEVEITKTQRSRVRATVPGFGAVLVPVPGAEPPSTPGAVLETRRYRVEVDPSRGGVVSLVHRESGRELVDPQHGHGLGAVVSEEVEAGSRHPMIVDDPKAFSPEHPGPDFAQRIAVDEESPRVVRTAGWSSITWTSATDGGLTATHTLVVDEDGDDVDLTVTVAKPAVLEPESVFVVFPFAVAEPEFLLETAGAVYAAGTEQLPDTSKDWFSIQHATAVTDDEHGLLWGTFDAPLVQLGGFHTGQWARDLVADGGQVNSWLMNNLHFTNFQASQGGTSRFRYRFRPLGRRVLREDVRRFGEELALPLQARRWAGELPGPAGLRVEPADDVLVELRPMPGRRVRARLRNTRERTVDVGVTLADTRHAVTLGPLAVTDLVLDRPGR